MESTFGESVLDVLILYTDRVEREYIDEDGVRAHVLLSMASANTAFRNSEVDIRLVLRAVEKIDYVESEEDFEEDLDFITDSTNIAARRDETGADLVCLFRNWLTADQAGLAWVLQDEEGDPSAGFSIVAAQLAVSGFLFTHEIGHNLGGAHDRENADAKGLFPYSYGHRFTGSDSVDYRTIMAYAPGERINYFSNPNLEFSGVPIGIAEGSEAADNARTLNFAGPTVNAYRDHIHLHPIANAGEDRIFEDADGDGFHWVPFDGTKSVRETIISWEWSWSGGSAEGPYAEFYLPLGQTEVTLKITDDEGFSSSGVSIIDIRETATAAQLAAGSRTGYYIRGSGFAVGFGVNDYAELGVGYQDYSPVGPTEIPMSDIASVEGGFRFSLFRRRNGSVWGSGINELGQLGLGDTQSTSELVQIIESGVSQISARSDYSLFLMEDGSLWGTGNNNQGQFGSQAENVVRNPIQIVESGVRDIAAGFDHCSWIDLDGAVWTMGSPSYWQLGNGSRARQNVPIKVIASGAREVVAGRRFTAVLMEDGSVQWYGTMNGGRYGSIYQPSQTIEARTPAELLNSGVAKIIAGDFQILIVRNDGSLWVMGENWFELDNLDRASWAPEPVRVLQKDVLDVAAGEDHFLVLRNDKSVWTVGDNDERQLGHAQPVVSFARKILDGVQELEGNEAPVANAGPDVQVSNGDGSRGGKVRLDGSASSDDWQVESWRWSWDGNTREGRRLDTYFKEGETQVTLTVYDHEGASSSDELMVYVAPQSRVARVDTGKRHTLVLKEDGSLWTSGSHVSGQLGIGEMSPSTPQHLMKSQEFLLLESQGVRFIKAVDEGGFFVKKDGSLWGVGAFGSGFSDDSSEESISHAPKRLLESGVKEVLPGKDHSLLLMDDGSLWGVGQSRYGQLGVNSNEPILEPMLIVEGGVVAASARTDNSLFVLDDGSLWGMGRNDSGQLGDGSKRTRFAPVQIKPSGVQSVSLAETYCLILEDDKRVYVAGLVPSSIYLEDKAEYLDTGDIVMAKAFDDHYLLLREDGALLAGGRHQGWFREGFETLTEVYSGRIRDFVSYWSRTFIVLKNGTLFGVGYDGENDGVFGRSVPGELSELTEILPVDFDTWLRRHFTNGEIAEMGDAAGEADPDNDGIPNDREIEWNLDPTQNFDPFRDSVSRFRVGSGYPVIEVSQYASGLDYEVWHSEDLRTWKRIVLASEPVEGAIAFEAPEGLSGFFKVIPSE